MIDPDARSTSSSRCTVIDEVSTVVAAVSDDQLSTARSLLAGHDRRWFCTGQGRSGLVAEMVAMRLMQLGFDVHVVGRATTPAIARDDGLIAFSASGETPVTLHYARLADQLGALIICVTNAADGALAHLAHARIDLATSGTRQFGGTLFEQSALIALDALVLDLSAADRMAYLAMRERHANLQ